MLFVDIDVYEAARALFRLLDPAESPRNVTESLRDCNRMAIDRDGGVYCSQYVVSLMPGTLPCVPASDLWEFISGERHAEQNAGSGAVSGSGAWTGQLNEVPRVRSAEHERVREERQTAVDMPQGFVRGAGGGSAFWDHAFTNYWESAEARTAADLSVQPATPRPSGEGTRGSRRR